jgi:hypothetical protein
MIDPNKPLNEQPQVVRDEYTGELTCRPLPKYVSKASRGLKRLYTEMLIDLQERGYAVKEFETHGVPGIVVLGKIHELTDGEKEEISILWDKTRTQIQQLGRPI